MASSTKSMFGTDAVQFAGLYPISLLKMSNEFHVATTLVGNPPRFFGRLLRSGKILQPLLSAWIKSVGVVAKLLSVLHRLQCLGKAIRLLRTIGFNPFTRCGVA